MSKKAKRGRNKSGEHKRVEVKREADFAANARYLIPAVLAAGCVFLAFLLSKVEEGVFYSGDGGLKYLMVRQFSEGDFSVYLHQAAPEWVFELWKSGMYHFSPPWVYDTADGHLIAYPLFFTLLSTPLYIVAGFKGLYVIPAAALVLLWLRFTAVCKLLGTKPINTLLATAGLVLASPLMLYGAAFWEHTAAALLVFFAVEFAVRAHLGECSTRRAILLGAASGVATWLRPEALPIVGLLGVFSLMLFFRNRMRSTFWFLGAAVFFAAIFFVANWILYGHLLGAHSFQIASEELTAADRFASARQILWDMAKELLEYFPFVAAFILALPLLFLKERRILAIGLAVAVVAFWRQCLSSSPTPAGGNGARGICSRSCP